MRQLVPIFSLLSYTTKNPSPSSLYSLIKQLKTAVRPSCSFIFLGLNKPSSLNLSLYTMHSSSLTISAAPPWVRTSTSMSFLSWGAQNGHNAPYQVSEVLNRGEKLLPSTCWLLSCYYTLQNAVGSLWMAFFTRTHPWPFLQKCFLSWLYQACTAAWYIIPNQMQDLTVAFI